MSLNKDASCPTTPGGVTSRSCPRHSTRLPQIAPKEDELKSLQAYSGPLAALSPPERFLVMLARIPRVADKMNLLLLRKTFKVLQLSCPRHSLPFPDNPQALPGQTSSRALSFLYPLHGQHLRLRRPCRWGALFLEVTCQAQPLVNVTHEAGPQGHLPHKGGPSCTTIAIAHRPSLITHHHALRLAAR